LSRRSLFSQLDGIRLAVGLERAVWKDGLLREKEGV
jgi:hypothetical protein